MTASRSLWSSAGPRHFISGLFKTFVGRLQKAAGRDIANFPDYRQAFGDHFLAPLPRPLLDASREAVDLASKLPDSSGREAYRTTVFYAALGAAGKEREIPNSYQLDEPVNNRDPEFNAVQHNALYGWKEGQKARQNHPDSPEAAFFEALSSISKAIKAHGNYGAPLRNGTPQPTDIPIQASPFWFRDNRPQLTNPSKAMGDVFERAANAKVNLLVPELTPKERTGQNANEIEPLRETKLNLPPALERFQRLKTAGVGSTLLSIGTSQAG
jgi:hypothetical protein